LEALGLAKEERGNTINTVMRMEKEKYQNIPGLDEVRTWIEEYVKKVANLRDQRGQEIELLYLRDRIEEWLSFYGSKGAFVDPEKTRVGNFDALLEKQGSLLVKMLDKKRFEEERKKIKPSKERWWWWIDERVKREKIMKLRRQMALLGIVIAALLSLYFLVFRLPPTEKKYLDALSRAEQLMDAGRWTEAIAACEEAIAIFPDRPNPYVIIGCIREKLGEENQAQEIFSQAESLYAKRVDFLLEKALWYFRLGMTDRSLATLSELLKEDPENLSALNLLGSVYEAENRVVEAIKVYERLLELAEKKEDLNLIPIAKMKIGMLQLKLPLTLP
jgi:tetratricopeptide (TPR) repeat protein